MEEDNAQPAPVAHGEDDVPESTNDRGQGGQGGAEQEESINGQRGGGDDDNDDSKGQRSEEHVAEQEHDEGGGSNEDSKGEQGASESDLDQTQKSSQELERCKGWELRFRSCKRDGIAEVLRTDLRQVTGKHHKALLFQLALAAAINRNSRKQTLMELPLVVQDDAEMSGVSLFGKDGVYSKFKGGPLRPPHPLHLAAELNRAEVIGTLLQMGMNVDATDDSSRTALHVASQYGSTETIDTLLQRNADINARTLTLKSPLFIAIENRQESVAKKLLDQGADPLLTDDLGRTVAEVGKLRLPEDSYKRLEGGLRADGKTVQEASCTGHDGALEEKFESTGNNEFNNMVTEIY
eukprot:gb/GECG01005879.1/.p1 GENE.gb/GECG01005879.1/~~gb/GECG01005879.1/.p1  ORF type:complete len:351 (+),score=73.48 gb/GECG01005879.1/:1-1053(+)